MAKTKNFEYHFEMVDPINTNAPIRVAVKKYEHQDTIGTKPLSPILGEYAVYGSNEEGLMCDCPSSKYQAKHGRCKHVEWVESWLEMREESYSQRDFYYSTINEKFIEIT